MIVGVVFSVLASLAMNLGNLVEKRAVDALPRLSGHRAIQLFRTLLTSRMWMVGFVITLFGLTFQVLAFASAPIPVVQSIFNAGIVLLLIASRLHLRERLTGRELVGLGIVIVSVVAIATTLGGTSAVGTRGSGLTVLLAAIPTVIGVGIVLALIRSGMGGTGFLFGVGAGLLYGIASLATKGASTYVVKEGVVRSLPLIFGSAYPYLFAGFSVLALMLYQTGIQRSRFAVVGAMSDVVASTYVVGVGTIVFAEGLPQSTVSGVLRYAGFVGVLLGSVLVAAGADIASRAPTASASQPRLLRLRRRRPAHAAPRRSSMKVGGRAR